MGKRSRAKASLSNAPPPDTGFVWLTREMLQRHNWRALSINAHRYIEFLLIEHMAHAGTENGRLQAPHLDLVRFGIPRRLCADALREAEALGWVDIERGRRIAGKNEPSLHRLTWLPDMQKREPATDRWRKITETDVAEFRCAKKIRSSPHKVTPQHPQVSVGSPQKTAKTDTHKVTKTTPTSEAPIYISVHDTKSAVRNSDTRPGPTSRRGQRSAPRRLS